MEQGLIQRRGHNRSNETGAGAPPSPSVQTDGGDRPARRTRKPFGAQTQKLAYEQREGYHRHWFNDTPGRIEQAIAAGYEHVVGRDGKNMSMPVGVHANQPGALIAFLMEIPQEWFDEDMAAQQQIIDEKMELINRGADDNGRPGEDGRYVKQISIKGQRLPPR